MSTAFAVPILDLDAIDPQKLPKTLLDPKICADLRLLPLSKRNNRLLVATSDPTNQQAQEKIKFATQYAVDWVVVEHDKLSSALRTFATANPFSTLEESGRVLSTLLSNLAREDTPKFRRVNLTNAKIKAAVLGAAGAREVLIAAGFSAVEDGSALEMTGDGASARAAAASAALDEALVAAAVREGVAAEDVLIAAGERSLHLADALLLAGPRSGELQWDAAMHGVLLVAAPGHASVDPQAVVLGDMPKDADRMAARVIDLLMAAPTYRARKAVLRRGTASRQPVSR
jgi:hypothetical protein